MGRYLVTGCAGFIGSHVTAMLLDQGHEVLGIDNLNQAYDPRLKAWRLERLRRFLEEESAAGTLRIASTVFEIVP